MIFFLTMMMMLAGCESSKKQLLTTSFKINTNWQFAMADSGEWLPAKVPGTVHTDLLAAGKIEDPFYRLNEKDLQWIDKLDWEYKTTFEITDQLLLKDRIEIIFHGLDTYAEVYLNDRKIFSADNMFRTWRVECRDILQAGSNELRVLLKSPINIGLEKLEKLGYQLDADNDQSENGGLGDKRVSIFTRKAPYHFGWDWGPRLVTSGIWRNIELLAWDDARIESIQLVQKSLDDSRAKMEALVEINALSEQVCHVAIQCKGLQLASEALNLKEGLHTYNLKFEIENPKLWWPNGLGEQNQYALDFLLSKEDHILDEDKIMTGLRTIKLVQEEDADGQGRSFYFEVNGRPVFAKGANYIPNDIFLPRVSPEDYEHIVKSAADANMNMLRVWGGGIYESDLFYDLCDKYGIMIWQDFMFACAMYPGDSTFLDNVRHEAIDNVKRLRNHVCLALWCGNNEIEAAWGPYDENRGWGWKQRHTPEQRNEIWQAYDTLFHKILPEVVAAYDAKTDYWHSSPSAGMGELASYDTRAGDMHYWGVWHGQHPFSDFKKYKARFMSEYGFQSFPEFASVQKYTLPQDWDIESEVMAAHQRSGIGNLRIRQYMEDDYQIPDDFEQVLYVGQLLQAEGIKSAIEAHRSDMPYCMGSLYWQINDCWPVASWSGMDWYGRWKALHYFVKDAFKNTIIVVDKADDDLIFRVISDRMEAQVYKLQIQLIDFDGKVLMEKDAVVENSGNQSRIVYQIPKNEMLALGDPKAMMLVANIESEEKVVDRAIHYFAKAKDLKLPNPEIEWSINSENGQTKIVLESSRLAKNVFLINGDCHFSDNYFDLLPGVRTEVFVETKLSPKMLAEQIRIMHLEETMK